MARHLRVGATLASLVAELRRVVRDDARKPRFLRTVHGYGYAFCGEAVEEPGSASGDSDSASYRLTVGRREVDLREGENVLGRTREAVAWVDGSSVSRRHARIVVRGGSATLEDLPHGHERRLAGPLSDRSRSSAPRRGAARAGS